MSSAYICPRCGENTTQLHEGYCLPCCVEGQSELDAHNAQFSRWEKLSDAKREAEIRRAAKS